MRQEIQCTPAAAVQMFAAQLLSESAAASTRTGHWSDDAKRALTQHWPEYMIEGFCPGMFMISACIFAVLLDHPTSPVRMRVANADLRRFLGGMAMGLTAVLLIYSPFGRRSGAHMNPATTLTFYRLGKVASWDAVFYVMSQFAGGVVGTLVAFAILGRALSHPNVNFAITRPGMSGISTSFIAEIFITFLLMFAILNVSNSQKFAQYTGLVVGTLVTLFITFEAPFSGMSMNPARSFASDFVGMHWQSIWIYFTAPVIGMLTAAEVFVRTRGLESANLSSARILLNASGVLRGNLGAPGGQWPTLVSAGRCKCRA